MAIQGGENIEGGGERENERKDSTNVKNKPTPNERNKRERTTDIKSKPMPNERSKRERTLLLLL